MAMLIESATLRERKWRKPATNAAASNGTATGNAGERINRSASHDAQIVRAQSSGFFK